MADENKFLTIKDGVVKGCDKSATEITIPEGVTKIGEMAFSGCHWVAEIHFGGTVSQWKAVKKGNDWNSGVPACTVHCVGGKTQQTDPVVSGTANGSGPLTIEGGVVTGCDESATEIAIPEGVTEIGAWAFYGCQSLTDITIPDSVTEIGASAFEGCQSLASITIPDSVTEIGACAFAGCRSLASITMPDSVTEIGEYAFSYCESLSGITIPNSVTEIGAYAFGYCESLASITIPDSVTKIGARAFDGCESLADIHFGGTVSQWKAVEKGKDWNSGVPASTVHCTDGEMQQTR